MEHVKIRIPYLYIALKRILSFKLKTFACDSLFNDVLYSILDILDMVFSEGMNVCEKASSIQNNNFHNQ